MADTTESLPSQGRPGTVGFFAGLRYPFRGAHLVFVEHPRLARFWIPPILITAAAIAGAAWLSLHYREALLDAMWASPDGEGLLAAIVRHAHLALGWLLALALFVVSVVLVVLLSSIVAAPFNDALSEAVEGIRGKSAAPPFTLRGLLADVRRTVLLECGKLSAYLLVMGPLFVVSLLLPGVGPAIYTLAAFYFTTLYFALDYVDWPASRRGLGIRQRIGLASRHFRGMLGFGIGVWLFMYVPLLNLLFMPGAVAGGTLLFLDLHGPEEASKPLGAGEGTAPSRTQQ